MVLVLTLTGREPEPLSQRRLGRLFPRLPAPRVVRERKQRVGGRVPRRRVYPVAHSHQLRQVRGHGRVPCDLRGVRRRNGRRDGRRRARARDQVRSKFEIVDREHAGSDAPSVEAQGRGLPVVRVDDIGGAVVPPGGVVAEQSGGGLAEGGEAGGVVVLAGCSVNAAGPGMV